jgi:hypothetical protein
LPLIEIEYHAASRTVSFFGEIHYKEKSPQSKDVIRNIRVKPKKAIFDLYQSFETAEIKKPKPALYKFFVLPFLFLPIFYLFYDKYLHVPAKEQTQSTSSVPASEELRKYKNEAAILRYENITLKGHVEELIAENTLLKQAQELKERVFLPVVYYEGKKLSIDPETQAVVEVETIARLHNRQLTCVNDGLTCYYDRPVDSAVRIADVYSAGVLPYGQSAAPVDRDVFINTLRDIVRPASVKQSAGSFVDVDLVPAPERLAR